MKVFVATYVDVGDSCDGKARTLGVFPTEELAKEEVEKDMAHHIDAMVNERRDMSSAKIDANGMSIYVDDYHGCEWNVEEIDYPCPNKDVIKKTEQVLIDNGIEEDEASTVLQAIGYTLMDTELYPDDEDEEF